MTVMARDVPGIQALGPSPAVFSGRLVRSRIQMWDAGIGSGGSPHCYTSQLPGTFVLQKHLAFFLAVDSVGFQ